MSYENLSDEWSNQSLSDDVLLADVVDLFLSIEDRAAGCLLALVCSPEGVLLSPVKIDELPVGCDREEQRRCVERLVRLVQRVVPGGALALGIGRDGQVVQTHWDSAWQRELAAVCRREGVTALGVALATPAGSVPLDAQLAAA